MCESFFRGKRIPHGEWINGFLLICDERYLIIPGTKIGCVTTEWLKKGEYAFYGFTEVDPDTVGEFSGKRDKNDRQIFEGDIVDGLFRYTTPLRAVCAFKDGAFGLAWTHGGVDYFSAFTSICNVVKYEVVGNIYDNPELLEVEE